MGLSFYTSDQGRPPLKEVKRKRILSFSGGSTFQVQETAVQRPWGRILVSVVVEQCGKPLCGEKNKQGEWQERSERLQVSWGGEDCAEPGRSF